MDAQSLLGLSQLLIVVILLLVCANLYLLFKLKDIDPFKKWNPHKINGWLMLGFMVIGFIVAFWSSGAWADTYIMTENAASDHGEDIDYMFWLTMAVVLFVFVVTNFFLFYFAFRYRQQDKAQKAYFYADNDRLEIVWTIIPAIVLAVLVFTGLGIWHDTMGAAPKEALKVELNAKQFAWTIRYPGVDQKFGESHVRFINEDSGNELGFNFKDKLGLDDFISDTVHLPKGYPVELTIRSRDVLHSATMMHFRVKMDAVPGMPTHFWFTPNKTTAEMREILEDSTFNYELSCQEVCGGGHWNMRRVIVVDEPADFEKWYRAQRPFYAQYKEMNAPPAPEPVPVPVVPADTTAVPGKKDANPKLDKPVDGGNASAPDTDDNKGSAKEISMK